MSFLSPADFAIIAFYLISVTMIGLWSHRGQKNSQDFLLAGKSVGWLPMGISIAAAFISGISYMGLPAEVRTHGLGFLLYAFAYVLVIPVITRLFLPFYGRVRITTAYEYLEMRFNGGVRRFCSGLFIFWRLLWLATVIYVPSLLISTLAAVPLFPSVIVIGLLTTAYTAVGGLRAVIWTDVIQFFIMVGGALAAIQFAAGGVPDGLAGIFATAEAHGRLKVIDWSLDPTARMTIWGALIGGFFSNLAFFGVDQMVIQRYLATRSAREMRSTFLLNCIALFVVVGVLAMLGLSLFAYYQARPDALPKGTPPDQVLPFFLAHEFPAGLRGLLVASIFAASMSALSSGVNAVTTAIFTDFMPAAGGKSLRMARGLSLMVGMFCTALAAMVGKLGSIMEIAVRVIDGFAGPLLAIFLIGMLTSKVRSAAVLWGSLIGLAVTTAANFWSPLSFVWYPAVGCVVTVAAAAVIHILFPPLEEVDRAALRSAD